MIHSPLDAHRTPRPRCEPHPTILVGTWNYRSAVGPVKKGTELPPQRTRPRYAAVSRTFTPPFHASGRINAVDR